jgi:hypothetical protein
MKNYIITLIILVITFMQDIYNYIPETNHFIGHTVLHIFCIYNLCYMQCYFAHEICFIIL